ncbi:hypothetical protein HH308_10275 [Gordonia sp. TBRC 11910]|uniref:Uncharacterized protein n=1 Tax=Gordonia asplenii TaxID=2725283 RepID=A0A848L1S0_9ACTN|nr:hypothetical protein [Gordonia asplenii]NMO01598.1 hypothetical protein [Gordonia asplenii]
MFKIFLLDALMFLPIYVPVALELSGRFRDAFGSLSKLVARSPQTDLAQPALGTPALAAAN